MPAIIRPVGAPDPAAPKPSLARRWLWFLGLSVGGTALTGVVAYGLHALLRL
jgi:hypothetical protein